MATGKFYHVTIRTKSGVTNEQLEAQMNKALDWYRYIGNSYVVFSTAPMNVLMGRLKPLVDPDGGLFICELNMSNRNGWMPRDFWNWLKKDRTKKD